MMSETNEAAVQSVVRQRWYELLCRIEGSKDNTIWVAVDEFSHEWQDLKEMARRGIVFPGSLRNGGKEFCFHAYENSRQTFERFAV